MTPSSTAVRNRGRGTAAHAERMGALIAQTEATAEHLETLTAQVSRIAESMGTLATSVSVAQTTATGQRDALLQLNQRVAEMEDRERQRTATRAQQTFVFGNNAIGWLVALVVVLMSAVLGGHIMIH